MAGRRWGIFGGSRVGAILSSVIRSSTQSQGAFGLNWPFF